MNIDIHKAERRGHTNHGWLDSYHSFSFAGYYNPERMQFGALRVLNDDVVEGGRGFDLHPHDNMEIVSIPLAGKLEHKDSMGNVQVITEGEIQVMSAGTGIFHSEYNKESNAKTNFLQIWILPQKKGVNPRYQKIALEDVRVPNHLFQILSPSAQDQGVWIHQDAWFHLGEFNEGSSELYELRQTGNGVYLFVLDGQLKVAETVLDPRDGIAISNTNKVEVEAVSHCGFLLMEVPII